jgi:hypothetical protein
LCSLANQMRGFLTEHGIIVAKGFAPLRRALPELLEQPELNPLFRELLGEMAEASGCWKNAACVTTN